MVTRYRTIKIEVKDEEELDEQLQNSLATGIHKGQHINIYAGEWVEEDPNNPQYFSSLKSTKVDGAITQFQLNQLKVKDQLNEVETEEI